MIFRFVMIWPFLTTKEIIFCQISFTFENAVLYFYSLILINNCASINQHNIIMANPKSRILKELFINYEEGGGGVQTWQITGLTLLTIILLWFCNVF